MPPRPQSRRAAAAQAVGQDDGLDVVTPIHFRHLLLQPDPHFVRPVMQADFVKPLLHNMLRSSSKQIDFTAEDLAGDQRDGCGTFHLETAPECDCPRYCRGVMPRMSLKTWVK